MYDENVKKIDDPIGKAALRTLMRIGDFLYFRFTEDLVRQVFYKNPQLFVETMQEHDILARLLKEKEDAPSWNLLEHGRLTLLIVASAAKLSFMLAQLAGLAGISVVF